jgi:flagellar protein FlaG
MDGIANVAKQQQTQVDSQNVQGRTLQQSQQLQDVATNKKADIIKQMQDDSLDSKEKINSQDQMKKLV